MDGPTQQLSRQYPRSVKLENGAPVGLRLMTAADATRIVSFARSLPEEDLLFLRVDITDPAIVAQWVHNVEVGRTIALIAEANGEMAGYAALHYNETTWQRHVGEIRIQVGPRYRSHGLGRVLAGEIFAITRNLGLRKIVAHMTAEQKRAAAMLGRLGFRPEALLQDFVIDRAGRTRDLVVMSYDVEGLTDSAD
jgi:RimJ/RimL family protein N-acetyltransferase